MSSSLWADEVTFNFTSSGGIDPIFIKATSGASTTWDQNPFTFTFTSAGASQNVEVDSDRGLKLQSNASFSISTSTAFISSIVLTYSDNHFANSSISGGTNDETTHTQTISGSFQNITFTNNTSNNNYIKEIKITYALIEENPVYSGAHEWNFTANRTAASTLTAKNKWVQRGTDGEGNVLLNYNKAVSNEPLYISDTQLLPETKGLTFSSNSVGDIYTNIRYDLSLTNGASVTIPNLKKGQVVTLAAFLWDSEVVSLTNATVKGTTDTSISVTDGNEMTKELTVTADGAVTLKTSNNSEVLNIRYIKTNAGPLTRFSSMGGQPYVHQAGGAAFRHTIIVEPHDALPKDQSSNKLKESITVTSSNDDAFNVNNITLSYDQSKGRLLIDGIQPGATNGTYATLSINYHGSPYDAQTITTREFYIRKAASVTFPQSSKTIRYDDRPEQGQSVTVQTAERIVGDGTIKYKSSSNIVEVDEATGAITAINGTGAVVITAYTEQTDEYAYAEASYTLNVTAEGDVAFYFLRDETKVNIGKSAYLELAMPGVKEDKINELYFIIKDPDGVDHKVYAYGGVTPEDEFSGSVTTEVEKNGDGQIISARIKILADDNVLAVGKSLIVTAYLDYKYTPAGTQDEVRAEASSVTKLTFTGADVRNWEMSDLDAYVYVGDVIGVRGITGNPNANEGVEYALAKNKSGQYLKDGEGESKTVYRPKSNTLTYGIYNQSGSQIVTEYATLFHCEFIEKFNRDTLLIYAKKKGDVRIQATDVTTGKSMHYVLHIRNRNEEGEIKEQSSEAIAHFPYTWDFTQPVGNDTKERVSKDDAYWSHYSHSNNGSTEVLPEGVYCTNMGYARKDVLSNGRGWLEPKNFTAFGALLSEFKGLQIRLGTDDVSSTYGRVNIHTKTEVGESIFEIEGDQYLFLPELGKDSKSVNGDYMIWIEAKGKNGSLTLCQVSDYTATSYTALSEEKPLSAEATQVGFLVPAGTQNICIKVENCYINWIAATTEKRTINVAHGVEGEDAQNADMHLATYSYYTTNGNADYHFDFDLTKVDQTQGVDAWIVKGFNAGENKPSVVLQQVENEIPAETGMILRKKNPGTETYNDVYMIVKAHNVPYTDTREVSNLLIPTGMEGFTIYPESTGDGKTEGEESITYILSSQYYWGRDADKDKYNDKEGYGFFKLGSSIPIPGQMAYLSVPKDMFDNVNLGGDVNTNGSGEVKLYLVFGDEDEWTSIEDVRTNSKADGGDEGYYTLQGTRVAQPTKGGIYIHQGKKIFVK